VTISKSENNNTTEWFDHCVKQNLSILMCSAHSKQA